MLAETQREGLVQQLIYPKHKEPNLGHQFSSLLRFTFILSMSAIRVSDPAHLDLLLVESLGQLVQRRLQLAHVALREDRLIIIDI